jgi:hypothetical protein
MSDINTNGMNINYPVPGVNNSTQGFRDNFSSIKTNLDVAKTELNDLQGKVLVKSALNNTTLNNDMAGGIISNVETKMFRSSTYDLGASLTGIVVVDVQKGDVQYGVVTGDVSIYFDNWPATTGNKIIQSKIQLRLTVTNPNAVITFPPSTHDTNTGSLVSGPTASVQRLENYGSQYLTPGVFSNQVGIPVGVSLVVYNVATMDCGTTLEITPVNRNQKASAFELRTPTSTGLPGDGPGTVCSDGQYMYLCVGNYDGESPIWGKVPLYVIS